MPLLFFLGGGGGNNKKTSTGHGSIRIFGFPELKTMKLSDTRWMSHERCVQLFVRDSLHCCKLFHSYMSHLEMLRHMVMVYQAFVSYQKFSCSIKLVPLKKIA